MSQNIIPFFIFKNTDLKLYLNTTENLKLKNKKLTKTMTTRWQHWTADCVTSSRAAPHSPTVLKNKFVLGQCGDSVGGVGDSLLAELPLISAAERDLGARTEVLQEGGPTGCDVPGSTSAGGIKHSLRSVVFLGGQPATRAGCLPDEPVQSPQRSAPLFCVHLCFCSFIKSRTQVRTVLGFKNTFMDVT